MKNKNIILFILFGIFIFLNLADSITAYFIRSGETNPLYLLTGSLLALYIIKLLSIYLVYVYVKRNIFSSNFGYFLLILLLTLGSLAIGLGCYSNIYGMLHPEIISEVSKLPVSEKVVNYFNFTFIIFILPTAFCLLAFCLYDKSYKNTKIDKQWYKNRRWWQV